MRTPKLSGFHTTDTEPQRGHLGHGRLWPNRLQPILVVSVFWPNFQSKKSRNPEDPKTYILTWTPTPPCPNPEPGERGGRAFEAHPSGPHPSAPSLPTPSPQFSFFLPSLGSLLVVFWWCLKRKDPQMCTFGLSGCRVKPRQLWGRRGFTRQAESPNVHISRPRASKTPPKFHVKTPKEKEKERNGGGRGKKKREFLCPTLRVSTLRAPTLEPL